MNAVEQTVPAGAWSADLTHSVVAFEVEHMGVSTFEARFTDYDVQLVTGDDGLESLTGSVHVASVDIRDEGLQAHVLAPDFFDAQRHPVLSFRSSSIDVYGEDVTVQGELTIKGISQQVSARGALSGVVADPMGNTRMGAVLALAVDRRDYGLDFELAMPDGTPALGYEVILTATLELIKDA